VIRNLSLFFVAVFWLSVAFWVYKDARRRIEDPWLVAMATLLGLVPPFVGAIIYMLFRPPEYLDDVRERELEIKAMEERLSRRDLHCPVCRADVDASFLVCPVCTTRLRQSCRNCKAPLEALWQVCPYCENAVEPAAVQLEETQALAPPRRERRA
jgi:predicted amidophosphoribosyltransferase